MRGIARVVCVLFVLTPNVLAAQTSAGGQAPRRFSVHAAAGSTLQEGGSVASVSFGFSPTRRFTMLVGGERTYLPTRVERYPDGGTSATRGGTLQLFTAEARFALRDLGRVAPYTGA